MIRENTSSDLLLWSREPFSLFPWDWLPVRRSRFLWWCTPCIPIFFKGFLKSPSLLRINSHLVRWWGAQDTPKTRTFDVIAATHLKWLFLKRLSLNALRGKSEPGTGFYAAIHITFRLWCFQERPGLALYTYSKSTTSDKHSAVVVQGRSRHAAGKGSHTYNQTGGLNGPVIKNLTKQPSKRVFTFKSFHHCLFWKMGIKYLVRGFSV